MRTHVVLPDQLVQGRNTIRSVCRLRSVPPERLLKIVHKMREADVKLISGEPKCWTRPAENGGRAKYCYFCGTCGIRLPHMISE